MYSSLHSIWVGLKEYNLIINFFLLFTEGSLCVGATQHISELKILSQSGISLYNLECRSIRYSQTQKFKFNIIP